MERWFGWRWMERWNELTGWLLLEICSSVVLLGSLEEFAGGETTFEDPCEPKISHSAGGKEFCSWKHIPCSWPKPPKTKKGVKMFFVSCKVREESRCLKTTHCFHEKDWFHDWRIDINWPTFFSRSGWLGRIWVWCFPRGSQSKSCFDLRGRVGEPNGGGGVWDAKLQKKSNNSCFGKGVKGCWKWTWWHDWNFVKPIFTCQVPLDEVGKVNFLHCKLWLRFGQAEPEPEGSARIEVPNCRFCSTDVYSNWKCFP